MKYPKRKFQKRSIKRKTPYKKKSVSFAVKKYVKRTIHRSIENKYHIQYASNQTVSNPFVISLVPNCSQGTGHSQRTGNSITLMKGYVEIYLNNAVYNLTTNPSNLVVYRWFLISQRKDNSNAFDFGSFFEINNSSTILQYNHLDQLFAVNNQKYNIHKQGRFTLGNTSTSTSFPAANSIFDNSKSTIYKKWYFNRYLHKKISFDDNGTTPTNTNCWLVILPTYANGATSSGYTPANISYVIHNYYEDA